MIGSWLNSTEREPCPYSQFKLIDVDEFMVLSEPTSSHLAELLRDARFDPGFLEAMSAHLDWKGVRELIIRGGVPEAIPPKRGDFGEILITAILKEVHGYTIPVSKLRFKVTKDQLMPGTDSLALRVNGKGVVTEVCFVESKLRTSIRGEQDRMVAVAGCSQLKKDYENKLPDILPFMAARLYEAHNELFDAFADYLRTRRDTTDLDTFRLGLFVDREAWDERVLQNLEDHNEVLPRLVVHAVRINNLGAICNELFARMGVSEVSEDD